MTVLSSMHITCVSNNNLIRQWAALVPETPMAMAPSTVACKYIYFTSYIILNREVSLMHAEQSPKSSFTTALYLYLIPFSSLWHFSPGSFATAITPSHTHWQVFLTTLHSQKRYQLSYIMQCSWLWNSCSSSYAAEYPQLWYYHVHSYMYMIIRTQKLILLSMYYPCSSLSNALLMSDVTMTSITQCIILPASSFVFQLSSQKSLLIHTDNVDLH